MRAPGGNVDPGPSASRLSRVVGALPQPGWTPRQGAADGEPPPGPGWRSLASAGSGSALLWLLAAGLAVVLVAGFLMQRHGSAPAPASRQAAGPAEVTASSAAGTQIVVDVGGRVRHPGLVTLPFGSRVADAIAAAGGALRPRDLAAVNLAGRVADGQFLVIGAAGATGGVASAVGSGGTGGGALVSLNGATVDQLDALPGVGPVLAQRIVSWREQHGGFASVDQLQQVPGIGARKFADLKALVSP